MSNVGSPPATQMIDKDWFQSTFLPACAGPVAIAVILWTLEGLPRRNLFFGLPEDLITIVAVAAGAMVLYSIVEIDGIYKAFSVVPFSSFSKEIAGRYSVLVKYIEHFNDYPKRRYGIDSSTMWPRLWMTLASERRQLISDRATSYFMALIYYSIFRTICSVMSGAFCGLAVSLSLANFEGYWWSLLLAFWVSIFPIRNEYFIAGPLVQDRKIADFMSFSRMLVNPKPIIKYLGIIFLSFAAIEVFSFCIGKSLIPKPTYVILVALELFALFRLTHQFYSRMFFTALAFGQSIQAAFDVTRVELAKSLSWKNSSIEDLNEEKFWQSTSKFLLTGSSLIVPPNSEEKSTKEQGEITQKEKTFKKKKEAIQILIMQQVAKTLQPSTTGLSRYLLRTRLLIYRLKLIYVIISDFWDTFVTYVQKEPEQWN